MNKYLQDIIQSFRIIFSNWKYAGLGLIFTILIFSLNPLLRNLELLKKQFSVKLMATLVIAAPVSMSPSTFIPLLIISLLSGIVLTYLVFLLRRQVKMAAGAGVSGVILGIIAPACPACAVGVVGLIGLGGIVSSLPFKGAEIGFIGIALLLFSLVYMSKKVMTTVCDLPKKRKKKN